MKKAITYFNIAGFKAIVFAFGIALKVGKILLYPLWLLCAVLYGLSWFIVPIGDKIDELLTNAVTNTVTGIFGLFKRKTNVGSTV